ncbi:phage tail sheath family protein [Proteus mirabilis]|nr:phage tail sheath family protein [Proteus mirabilis]
MAQDYHHGVRVIEINEGTRPIRTISTAIVGVVCTADDADEKTFPLNKPVLLTDVSQAIGKAGKTGTLASTLKALQIRLNPSRCGACRQGESEAETTTNIMVALPKKG